MRGELAEKFAAVLGLRYFTLTKTSLLALPRYATHADTLAIRWIEQHHPRNRTRRHPLQGIATAKFDDIRHARAFGIALCKIDHPVRNIATINELRLPCIGLHNCIGSFFFHSIPDMALEGQILLKRKTAQISGGDIARDLRGFNRNRAATAAGVVERQ